MSSSVAKAAARTFGNVIGNGLQSGRKILSQKVTGQKIVDPTIILGHQFTTTDRQTCGKRNDGRKLKADCRKALELDNKSVKGHYFLGLALLHYQQYGRAVAELEKALDLGRGGTNGNYMVEEIWQELAKARYTQWTSLLT
ncbi:hypothetical protein R1sor_004628 [Riccia sorocarpa]|uniref:RING-type E3 ubiquitin transferase n=1 Tax=Riccia sorocarpa TaxID=122646 RepID=A0ABD3HHH3_9MARC